MELAARAPRDATDSVSSGSKRVLQYELRSQSPAKRPRLSASGTSSTASNTIASEPGEVGTEDDLAVIVKKREEAEQEAMQLQELIEKLKSRRLDLAWMARYKVSV